MKFTTSKVMHGLEQVSIDLGCWRMFIYGVTEDIFSLLTWWIDHTFYRSLSLQLWDNAGPWMLEGGCHCSSCGLCQGFFFLGDLDIGRPLLRLRLSTTSAWRYLHRYERGSLESSEYWLKKVSYTVSCSIKQYPAVSRCTTRFLCHYCFAHSYCQYR